MYHLSWILGGVFFLIGCILPRKWFCFYRFPYRLFDFEKEGRIYVAFGVRKWKDMVPDMSAILPGIIPSKKMPVIVTPTQVELLIRETCVAEWIHELLCFMGFGCVFLWKGIGGFTVSLLYVLGNIPYIIIQRYNRPKLIRLLQKLEKKSNKLYECIMGGNK